MDITFKQPQDCWLERAKVYITLGEDLYPSPQIASLRWGDTASRPLSTDYALRDSAQGVASGSVGYELVDGARVLGRGITKSSVESQWDKVAEPLSSPPAMVIGN